MLTHTRARLKTQPRGKNSSPQPHGGELPWSRDFLTRQGGEYMSAQIIHPHVSSEQRTKMLVWLSIAGLTAVAFIFAYFVNSIIVGAVSSTVADVTGRALKPEALDSIHSWMALGYTVMAVVTIAGLLRGSVRLRR